ncbi:glycosyltransferase family 2 protein [Aeromonas rivipollensis]|uniref:glycosyltransferase family 2 protein n=1 Tax=Aeromonas rivipollensis TaxID=948519 RepID=UPI003D21CDBE
MNFSLLVATLDRSNEIKLLLGSLRLSIEKDFEVIVVDQSDNNLTKEVVDVFDDLDIKYIKSNVRGLSLNRNIALRLSKGSYYCFPDDDCIFYPDTLEKVKKYFDANHSDFVLGRIFDRENNINLLKNWPSTNKIVNDTNYYLLSSSITMFYSDKCRSVIFDEDMGVGARYGACEDPDYLYRVLKSGFRGEYVTEVEVWHPEQKQADLSLEKIKSYTSGFGYFVRKNSSLYNFILLLLYIASKLFKLITFRIGVSHFKAIILGIYYGYCKK